LTGNVPTKPAGRSRDMVVKHWVVFLTLCIAIILVIERGVHGRLGRVKQDRVPALYGIQS